MESTTMYMKTKHKTKKQRKTESGKYSGNIKLLHKLKQSTIKNKTTTYKIKINENANMYENVNDKENKSAKTKTKLETKQNI